MSKKVPYTIVEVAKMLGVSPSTISRAMNDAPGVSAELKSKILKFVDEIGYSPNTIAQSLSRGRSNMIALILGDIRNPFYAELAFGIQNYLDTKGFIVTTFNSEYDKEKEFQYISNAVKYNYAGIIIVNIDSKTGNDYIKNIGIPTLLVNRTAEGYEGSMVIMDNFQAGYIATRYLINMGHKKIGFLSGNHMRSSSSFQRFNGFKQALSNYQLKFEEEYCMYNLDWRMDTGYKAAKIFFDKLDEKQRPSAIILANDLLALGFMDYCSEYGVEIPNDLSIISFDDIVYSKLSQIQLTTISQHVEEMSLKAAELMVELISEPNTVHRKIIIEPTLIERKTVKNMYK